MALIKCKACGAKVSKKAQSCPQCGEPIKSKRSCLGVLVLGFIGFIGFMVIGGVFTLMSKNVEESEPSAPAVVYDNSKVRTQAQEIIDHRGSMGSETAAAMDESFELCNSVLEKIVNEEYDTPTTEEAAEMSELEILDNAAARMKELGPVVLVVMELRKSLEDDYLALLYHEWANLKGYSTGSNFPLLIEACKGSK